MIQKNIFLVLLVSCPNLGPGIWTEGALDCSSLNNLADFDDNSTFSPPPLTNWEMSPTFSRCGIIPAQLVSNEHSHAKFFIHWLFNSHSSFLVSFRLAFVEDLRHLNYQFTVRQFTDTRELLTALKPFGMHTNSTSSGKATDENEDDHEALSLEDSIELGNARAAAGKEVPLNTSDRHNRSGEQQHEHLHKKEPLHDSLVLEFDLDEKPGEKFEMIKNM